MTENQKLLIDSLVDYLEDASYPLAQIESKEFKELRDLEDYQVIIRAISQMYEAKDRLHQYID